MIDFYGITVSRRVGYYLPRIAINDGVDSLHATLADSWRSGHLPVLTLANKGKFEHSREYAERVATDVAELMFGIAHQEYLEEPRIYVPRR